MVSGVEATDVECRPWTPADELAVVFRRFDTLADRMSDDGSVARLVARLTDSTTRDGALMSADDRAQALRDWAALRACAERTVRAACAKIEDVAAQMDAAAEPFDVGPDFGPLQWEQLFRHDAVNGLVALDCARVQLICLDAFDFLGETDSIDASWTRDVLDGLAAWCEVVVHLREAIRRRADLPSTRPDDPCDIPVRAFIDAPFRQTWRFAVLDAEHLYARAAAREDRARGTP